MRLCDHEIESLLFNKHLSITPSLSKDRISGITIDLSLGNKFRIFNNFNTPFIDLSSSKIELSTTLKSLMSDEITVDKKDLFYLHPNEMVLATTYESIKLPKNLVGWLDGRSSLARLGLMVHMTSHRIDPGWSGHIVLECFNSSKIPLALRPSMLIAALSFEKLSGTPMYPYCNRENAKYKNQIGPVFSRIDEEMS